MKGAPDDLPPLHRIRWHQHHRLVPSRYPPVDLFERLADPEDWELIADLEGLTNDRLRDEIGDISLVPTKDRIAGPGASPIMAAFTHLGHPSRFTAGHYGVYYASNQLEGALAEVLHHRARFLRRTAEPKTSFDLRTYIGSIDARLHDVRTDWPAIHDPNDYRASQRLGGSLRDLGGHGIVYRNVRRQSAHNLAIFRPSALAAPPGSPHTTQGPHLRVEWDGTRMKRYIVIGEPEWSSLPI